MKPFCHRLVAEDLSFATKIAHDFYYGEEEKREQARERILGFQITDDQILAEAMQIRAKELVVFD